MVLSFFMAGSQLILVRKAFPQFLGLLPILEFFEARY
jgi:hypothetical protein